MKKIFILLLVSLIPLTGFTKTTKDPINDTITSAQSFKEVIMPYVDKLLKGIEQGTEFIVSETPVVIREYIYYHAVMNWLVVLLGVFFLSLIPWSLKYKFSKVYDDKPVDNEDYEYKKINKNRYIRLGTNNDDEIPYNIFFYALYLIGGAIILFSIDDAIQATFFPKLYLVEHFLEFFK